MFLEDDEIDFPAPLDALQGDGLYTALLIKVLAYLLALRLQAQGVFSKLTLTEIMRQLRREAALRDFLATHFHTPLSIT